jgi:hypothetical protein
MFLPTLFNVKFNWGLYILALLCIILTWGDLSWLSIIALAITLHQFLLLFYSFGSAIPIRYIAGSFMCMQMLLGPVLAYNGLDAFQRLEYQMKIPELEYLSYAIPAVTLFILGLHISAGKLKGEILNEQEIGRFVNNSGNLPYIFIFIGFFSSVIAGYFGSELAFVFYLLGGFKFIGTFMLLLGTRKVKTWVLILVFGSIISSSLSSAMFHDLLTWLIMLAAVLAIKFKPGITVKAIVATSFILLALIIQLVKKDYRETISAGTGGGAGFSTFQKAAEKDEESQGLFNKTKLAKSNIRINQGYIITNIMYTVPAKVPFENGAELMRIVQSAVLPRIIAPNKLNAGDRDIFMKYTGLALQRGTSMGLSSMGDAYINFGTFGGCIFMFFLGLLFSEVLNGFQKYSRYYPFLLLFTPLVFYYPIRPDCELQTSLGHLVKSCFLIYMLILFWKKDLSKMTTKKHASPVMAGEQAF